MTTEILQKQKAIDSLRKAVTQAKTKLNDAKRDVKYGIDHVRYAKERQVGEYGNTAESIASEIARHETNLAEVKAALPLAEAALTRAQAELAAAEKALPAVKASKFSAILKWFSGTSLVKAKDALELLDASVEQGFWVPGASRKVRAAVGKPNVAKKAIDVGGSYTDPAAEQAIHYAVKYGSFNALSQQITPAQARKQLNGEALDFYRDFKPMVDAMDKLDATRPLPVFTTMNASPTVSAELKRQGAEAVEVAPIEWQEREGVDEKGNKFFYSVAVIIWPKGIKHSTSRYAYGTASNSQCHACGHAIRNAFNWVPLILTTKAGEKKSLWVGRDCAKTLFGVEMTGDLELAEGQR